MIAVGADYALQGAYAKLDRANDHLATLTTEVRSFLAERPYNTEFEATDTPGIYESRLTIERQPPIRLGVLVGDFAHNARTALDNALWALLTHLGRKSVAFPIVHDRIGGDQRLRQLQSRLPAAAYQAVEETQPYHWSDPQVHPLEALRRLSNVDKHEAIHPVFAESADEEPDITVDFRSGPDDSHAEVVYRPGVPIVDGVSLLLVRLHPSDEHEPDVAIKGGVPLDVAFGAEGRLRPTELADILRAAHDVVHHRIAPHLLGSASY
jgi:hypothetical protein